MASPALEAQYALMPFDACTAFRLEVAMMEPPPPHAPGGVLDGEERPDEVHVEDPPPLAQVGVDEGSERPDPGVGECDVQRTEPVLALVEEGRHVLLVADVAAQRGHVHPQPGRHLVGGAAVDVTDHHACSLGDESTHRGEADSRRAAGHEGGLPGEAPLWHGPRLAGRIRKTSRGMLRAPKGVGTCGQR